MNNIDCSFKKFCKLYYDAFDNDYPESYSYEELKTIAKPLLELKKSKAVGIKRKDRKRSIITTYILCTIISLILISIYLCSNNYIFLIILGVNYLLGFIFLKSLHFELITILISYLLFKDNSNIYKTIINDNFINDTISKRFTKINLFPICNNKSLVRAKYKLLDKNKDIYNISFKRNKVVCFYNNRIDIKKIVIKDKSLTKDEIYNELMSKLNINNINDTNIVNYEWIYLKNVKINEKFIIYGKKVKLSKCINTHKQKKLLKYDNILAYIYYFKLDFKTYYLLAYKVDGNSYSIFEKRAVQTK